MQVAVGLVDRLELGKIVERLTLTEIPLPERAVGVQHGDLVLFHRHALGEELGAADPGEVGSFGLVQTVQDFLLFHVVVLVNESVFHTGTGTISHNKKSI